MKKLGTIFASIFIIVALATSAFAFRTMGEVTTDRTGNAVDGFAPRVQVVIKVTKGFTNVDVTPYTKYKFFFTKAADDTPITVKVLLGGFTTGSEPASPTAGDTYLRGNKQKILGFMVYSSAGTNIHFFGQ